MPRFFHLWKWRKTVTSSPQDLEINTARKKIGEAGMFFKPVSGNFPAPTRPAQSSWHPEWPAQSAVDSYPKRHPESGPSASTSPPFAASAGSNGGLSALPTSGQQSTRSPKRRKPVRQTFADIFNSKLTKNTFSKFNQNPELKERNYFKFQQFFNTISWKRDSM